MKVIKTRLPGALILEPRIFKDERGSFFESWSEARYRELGVDGPFVQDNVSVSRKGVLRGLHYQDPRAQGKLVSVLSGRVFDVAVDVRRESNHFGQWVGVKLSSDNRRQFYVPPGFAHGFLVLSDSAIFTYKCTEYYSPSHERSLRWNDPEIGIKWPTAAPLLSAKDRAAPLLQDIVAESSVRLGSEL